MKKWNKTEMKHKQPGDSKWKCSFVISSLPSRLLGCCISTTHSHLSLSQIHPLWQSLLVKGHLEEKKIKIGIKKKIRSISVVIWQNEPAVMLGLPLVLCEGSNSSVCITAANRKPWDRMALLIGLSCLAPSN